MTDSRVSKVSKSPEGIERLRIREDLEVNLLRVAAGPSDNPTELAKRLVALVSTGSAMVDKIAAVILARKAIITLKERFRSHLIEPVWDEAAGSDEAVRAKVVSAIGELDQVFIDALQAFCTKLLRERALGGTQEGFSWSGMIHGVLAAAAVEIPSGILRNTCKDILSEYANPTDKSWESRGLVELDQALETVCTSELSVTLTSGRSNRYLPRSIGKMLPSLSTGTKSGSATKASGTLSSIVTTILVGHQLL